MEWVISPKTGRVIKVGGTAWEALTASQKKSAKKTPGPKVPTKGKIENLKSKKVKVTSPKKMSGTLLEQAKKALSQKQKVVEMFRKKYAKELSKLPKGFETSEIILYLTGVYIRKDKINYQLDRAVISEEERIVIADLFDGVYW